MKKSFLLLFIIIALAVCGSLTACGSSPNFSKVTGKDWKLVQIKIDGKDIHFNRKKLVDHDANHIFILTFDAQAISGVGAPNRYNAPYTLGDNKERTISVDPMRSTLMASLWQPEKLKESDYFLYIQNVYEWNLVNKHLELRSKTEDDKEVTLIFSL
jgi:heat shock protein HslJ